MRLILMGIAMGLLLSTSSCVSYGFRGVAHGASTCGEGPHGASFPLAGVAVSIRCPDGTALSTHSDEVGRFQLPLGRALAGDCSVEVSKEGYAARRYAIRELCAYELNEEFPECDAASLFARLVPR